MSNHQPVLVQALDQLPSQPRYRVGRTVLVRTDSAGGAHDFVTYLDKRRLSYSVGFIMPDTMVAAIDLIPEAAWTQAYDADGGVRDGAWVTEATGVLDLSSWSPGMRVIVRKGHPHRGAQLRFTDRDGLRLTAFGTNTSRGPLPTWNCGTAAPAARIASAPPKTPAWPTCPYTDLTRTGSGAPSCNLRWS